MQQQQYLRSVYKPVSEILAFESPTILHLCMEFDDIDEDDLCYRVLINGDCLAKLRSVRKLELGHQMLSKIMNLTFRDMSFFCLSCPDLHALEIRPKYNMNYEAGALAAFRFLPGLRELTLRVGCNNRVYLDDDPCVLKDMSLLTQLTSLKVELLPVGFWSYSGDGRVCALMDAVGRLGNLRSLHITIKCATTLVRQPALLGSALKKLNHLDELDVVVEPGGADLEGIARESCPSLKRFNDHSL